MTVQIPATSPAVFAQIELLETKYRQEGLELLGNLEKLSYERSISYEDYISQQVLLNIQQPKSTYPDEMIFIVYHQIVELYFKLILWELKQIMSQPPDANVLLEKVERINRYYRNIICSFSVMIDGMDISQFQQFRKALVPASGFQSLQYRLIEIYSTDFTNLLVDEYRHYRFDESELEEFYAKMYWKSGAIEACSGRKDLSLINFEKNYDQLLKSEITRTQKTNLRQKYFSIYDQLEPEHPLFDALRDFDYNANVGWKNAHLKAATKYLTRNSKESLSGTGGTNWKKYLPAKNQKVFFFPELLTDEEKEEWGS